MKCILTAGFYVYVGTVNGHDCNIWTRKFKGKSNNKKEPLVMMHGMGAGKYNFNCKSSHFDLYVCHKLEKN